MSDFIANLVQRAIGLTPTEPVGPHLSPIFTPAAPSRLLSDYVPPADNAPVSPPASALAPSTPVTPPATEPRVLPPPIEPEISPPPTLTKTVIPWPALLPLELAPSSDQLSRQHPSEPEPSPTSPPKDAAGVTSPVLPVAPKLPPLTPPAAALNVAPVQPHPPMPNDLAPETHRLDPRPVPAPLVLPFVSPAESLPQARVEEKSSPAVVRLTTPFSDRKPAPIRLDWPHPASSPEPTVNPRLEPVAVSGILPDAV